MGNLRKILVKSTNEFNIGTEKIKYLPWIPHVKIGMTFWLSPSYQDGIWQEF